MATIKFRPMASWERALTPGFDLLRKNANYIDRHTVPGHFPLGFTGARNGPFVETIDKKIPYYYDATNYWMTLPLDIARQFNKNESMLADIGYAVMNASTLSEFGSVGLAALVDKLKHIWPRLHRVLTYNSGTQATDAALKWATSLVMKKNNLKPKDMKFVAVTNAFHGRCGYGIEATRSSEKTSDYQTGITLRIPDPTVVFNEIGEVLKKETEARVQESLDVLEIYFKKPETSALIIEYPMIAEGGAIQVAPDFLLGARKLCDKYDKFLIADCVQMFGKSGSWLTKDAMKWADVIVIGKYARACATLFTNPTKRGFPDYAGISGKFGATWLGHESAILSTIAIMNVVDQGHLFDSATVVAKNFYDELKRTSYEGRGIDHPRIDGTYIGFDISAGTGGRDQLVKILQNDRVLILPAGSKSIRFAPRLDTEQWEIDYLLEHLFTAIPKIKSK